MLTKKNPTLVGTNFKTKDILAHPHMRPKETAKRKDHSYLFTHNLFSDLTNHYLITEQLANDLQTAKENNQVLTIFYLALNGLEHVRDIYGHSISDKARFIIVKYLKQILGTKAHLSHLSANVYIASLIAEKNQLEIIDKTIKKIRLFSSESIKLEGFTIKVGVCIGTTVYPIHGDKVGVLLDIAEKKCVSEKDHSP